MKALFSKPRLAKDTFARVVGLLVGVLIAFFAVSASAAPSDVAPDNKAPVSSPPAAIAPAATSALTPAQRFSKASAAMTDGDYGEGAYQLRELAASGEWSHGSLHNLGNAEWKVARPGYAILAWERARALDPADRNTVANLTFARKKAQLSEPERRWYEQYSEWLPGMWWLLVAGLSLWAGVALLSLPRLLGWQRAGWHQGLAALLLALFLLTTPALIGLWSRANIGVVLEDETRLRLTPTREGEKLDELHAGEVARVENVRGNYYYVRADHDRAGWVEVRDFAKIWP